jgi:UDP-2,3-diacylglucosamine pyrophosphatase LpxH
VNSIPLQESLLILSDVHLGNDLNDLRPRGPGSAERRSAQVDVDLSNLLAHYARTPPSGKRWRLVIAGDFIDFIGMAILPLPHELDTEPSDEELAHGLGNASDHGRLKLRAVVARHRPVFEALAAFVAQGHALTLIHGNHDMEFHWDGVKRDLEALLVRMALDAGGHDASFASEFASRIEFAPWFYYAAGVAYIEHGHQYDTLCSTEHVMAPLSPLDPRRIARSFSDVLLRWVVRPTKGVPEYGHERLGVLDYVMMGVHMGFGGLLRLVARFMASVLELFRLRRAYLTEAAQTVREEHERRMGALAVKMRIGIEKLRELAALQVPPVTRSIPKILAGVLLDRLILGLSAGTALIGLAVFAGAHGWSWAAMATVALLTLLAHRQLSARRRVWFGEKLDNDATLVDRAGRLATLFPAAFVVMGHTHSPVMVPVAQGTSTYVNVGSWHEAEDEANKPASFRAARTHLVIHPAKAGQADTGPVGEFLTWAPAGPTKFVSRSEA